MENLKEFFIKEVNRAVSKELTKKKLKESSKDLYDAVTLKYKLMKENAESAKLDIATKAIEVAEIKVLENYDELDNGCDCGDGEGKMLKAQLLSIISNAEKLFHMIDDSDQFEDWIQSKITVAEDYLRASYSYLTYYNGEGEADESDWDYEDEENYDQANHWDDFDDLNWEYETNDGDIDVTTNQSMYSGALDASVDDDELFETKDSHKTNT